jgi:imidazolonepropionase-like amidohydrolase
VAEGRIEALGTDPQLRSGAREIPLDGCTAIPGLIDAHVHLTLDPAIAQPRDQLRVPPDALVRAMEERALRMLCAGITTARDLGGGSWQELELRDRIERGEVAGPRLLCAGQPITSPAGHCHFWGGEARGEVGIDAVVRRQIEHRCDWIKIMVTGGVMTRRTRIGDAQFSREELLHTVRAAARHGRRVAAHCHGTRGIALAAATGVHTVEHCSFAGAQGFGSDYDPAVVEQLAGRARGRDGESPLWVSPTVNAGWARLTKPGPKGPNAFGLRMVRALRGLREAGVPLIASTDAGIPRVEHHRLPEALAVMATLAGLTPAETLVSATSESARALGLEAETGQLAVGLAADVLVVEGDPTRDLAALLRPRLVLARGKIAFEVGQQRASG